MYIINKARGLIFSHDQPIHSSEVEASFAYPIGGLVLEEVDRNVMVKFGEQQGIQGTGEGAYGLYRILLPKVQERGLMAYTVSCCPRYRRGGGGGGGSLMAYVSHKARSQGSGTWLHKDPFSSQQIRYNTLLSTSVSRDPCNIDPPTIHTPNIPSPK